jgi:hypothetical protein
MLKLIAEYAYELDTQHIKARAQSQIGAWPEIYDEALEGLIIVSLARQLAAINGVDDFAFKDIWEPQAKRLRFILSGLVNFCKYRGSQANMVYALKDDVLQLDDERLELVAETDRLERDVVNARIKNVEELPAMREAEQAARETQSSLDRLQQQCKAAAMVLQNAEADLKAKRDHVDKLDNVKKTLREQQAELQDQLADPEGLEQEIRELNQALQQKKAWLEDKVNEKRARLQRVQVCGRVKAQLAGYTELLTKCADLARADCTRVQNAREELNSARLARESKANEKAELEENGRQIETEIEKAKQAHAEREQQLIERRRVAQQQQEDMMAKRTDEQRKYHAVVAERDKLDSEIAAVRRENDAEMDAAMSREQAVMAEVKNVAHWVDQLLREHGGKDVMARIDNPIACSPSPARGGRSPARAGRSPAVDRLATLSAERRRSPAAGSRWRSATPEGILRKRLPDGYPAPRRL